MSKFPAFNFSKNVEDLIKTFRGVVEREGIVFINRGKKNNTLTKFARNLVAKAKDESNDTKELHENIAKAKSDMEKLANKTANWLRRKHKTRIEKIKLIKRIKDLLCDETSGQGIEFLCD